MTKNIVGQLITVESLKHCESWQFISNISSALLHLFQPNLVLLHVDLHIHTLIL